MNKNGKKQMSIGGVRIVFIVLSLVIIGGGIGALAIWPQQENPAPSKDIKTRSGLQNVSESNTRTVISPHPEQGKDVVKAQEVLKPIPEAQSVEKSEEKTAETSAPTAPTEETTDTIKTPGTAEKKAETAGTINGAMSSVRAAEVAGLTEDTRTDCKLIRPYVGLDVGWRYMPLRRNFGGKEVTKNYFEGNIYVGLRFLDCLGVELGYESTTRVRRTASLLGSDFYFGEPVDPDLPNGTNTFRTHSQIQGWHVDIVGFIPFGETSCWEMFGSIGIARLRLTIISDILISGSFPLPAAVTAANRLTFAQTKTIPRASVGLQYMATQNFGFRASIGWEGTHVFKNVETPHLILRASLRDSVKLGFGLFLIY